MTTSKTILWFPQLRYLSMNPYMGLVRQWEGGHRHILLDTSAYSAKFEAIDEVEAARYKVIFDEVYVLVPNKTRYSSQKHLDEFLRYRELKMKLKDLVGKEDLEMAVFPTDFSYEFRVLRKISPDIKLVALQVSFKQIYPSKVYSLGHKLKAFLYYHFLGVPLFRKVYHFGEQDVKAWYLLWTEKWAKSVIRPRKTKFIFSNSTLEAGPAKQSSALPEKLKHLIKDRPLITVFLNKRLTIGQPAFEQYADFYTNAANAFPQAFFLIKVHPNEDVQYCENLYSGLSSNNSLVVFKEYDADELLMNSDLFITQWSTAILTAMNNKIRTLLVNPENTHDMKRWFVDDYPFIATDKEELTRLINQLLMDNADYWAQVEQFVTDTFGPSFEGAQQKVLKCFYSILNSEVYSVEHENLEH